MFPLFQQFSIIIAAFLILLNYNFTSKYSTLNNQSVYNYNQKITQQINMKILRKSPIPSLSFILYRQSWQLSSSKSNYTKKTPLYSLYNQNLIFDCGDTIAKFVPLSPRYTPMENSKIIVSNKRAFSFRCISKENFFKKGATYCIFDLALKNVWNLIQHDFSHEFAIGNEQSWLKIRRLNPEQSLIASPLLKKKQQKKKSPGQSKQKKDQPLTPLQTQSFEKIPQILEIDIKTSTHCHRFNMLEQKFSIIREFTEQSLISLYAIDSIYQLQLDALMDRFNCGSIQDQFQMEERNFKLEGSNDDDDGRSI